jgi:hypothetical protein
MLQQLSFYVPYVDFPRCNLHVSMFEQLVSCRLLLFYVAIHVPQCFTVIE